MVPGDIPQPQGRVVYHRVSKEGGREGGGVVAVAAVVGVVPVAGGHVDVGATEGRREGGREGGRGVQLNG